MLDILIDPEFAALIPPLSADELAGLETSIRAEGCRDALVVWGDILLDGHNRKAICDRLGVAYRTVSVELADRDAAMDWIDLNQLARRNLPAQVASVLRGRVYNRRKKAEGAPKGNANAAKQLGQNEPVVSTAEAVAAETGVSPATVKRDGKLAAEVEADPELKAAMNDRMEFKRVRRAKKERKRAARRRANARKVQAVADPVKSGARYAAIVIDPPWDWGDEGDVNQMGRAKPDYATMSIDELLALPVGKLADEDCHLYLWITNRSLPKGFRLLEAWGFRYITALTWRKPSMGTGNYFRGITEHVLFGVKGSQGLKVKDATTLLPAWPRGKGGHSSKPVEFPAFVERCSPGPYLEMFGRAPRPGWSIWGEDSR